MDNKLPLNIDHLLQNRSVESARIEYKATYDKPVLDQILRTICAFANDLQNLNGGYILIGVGEENGQPVLPPRGVAADQLDVIQREIRGTCNRLEPLYVPVIAVEKYDASNIIIIWAPASYDRPHKAPRTSQEKTREYYVRLGSETVRAQKEILQRLLQATTRIPYDDQPHFEASLENIRSTLVKEYLHEVGSRLSLDNEPYQIYESMRLIHRANGHAVPRNVALLFFNDEPHQWFRGAIVEVAEFPETDAGETIQETKLTGPLPHLLNKIFRHLEELSTAHKEKQEPTYRARSWVSYPRKALREAVVNAVYHRSYRPEHVEPIKIHLREDRMEVISYPGPVDGIEQHHLNGDEPLPPVPARNRRIGEFLKELEMAEARGTGVPMIKAEMARNGSPTPRFDFDEKRTYFRVTLPAHPAYTAMRALTKAAYQRASGKYQAGWQTLERAWHNLPQSGHLGGELLRETHHLKGFLEAEALFKSMQQQLDPLPPVIIRSMAEIYLEQGTQTATSRGKDLLDQLSHHTSQSEALELAILERRAGREAEAHRRFTDAGDVIFQDPRALHEYAQAKMALQSKLFRSSKPADRAASKRYLAEAQSLLERVTQMDTAPIRHGWAWYNLGQVLQWQKAPHGKVIDAFAKAVDCAPDEARFTQALQTARRRAR